MAFALFNGTRPEGILTYVNDVTQGNFGWSILLVIFISAYVGMSALKSEHAFAGASFLTGIIAFIFFNLGIIQTWVLIVAGLFIMLSIVFLKVSRSTLL